MTEARHLAQMNVGAMVAAQGDPRVQPFFEALDEINRLPEASPVFVCRLTDERGQNATGIPYAVDPLLLAKLWHLDRFGPTKLAFTFKERSPAPGNAQGEALNADGICVG